MSGTRRRIYVFKRFERFWHWAQAALIIFMASVASAAPQAAPHPRSDPTTDKADGPSQHLGQHNHG